MASSSSGDGPSTSGRRRSGPEPYWDWDFVTISKRLALQDLIQAVLFQNIFQARNVANKLKAMGMFPDQAVAEEARDHPKSKRHGPLHVAAENMHLAMCRMLVEDYKCNPNATTADDETPLYFATKGGSGAVAKYLIVCGADPNKASNRGITPLHHAARRGYCEIARYLLFKGANVDPLCQDGETPLHFAALRGHVEMVKLLLAHGANLNRLSHDRRTPLVASIFGCSLECLRTFIEEGADITGSPVTPLSVAARKGLPDCIECLLNYNADPNEPNEYGKLPLEIAASKRWRSERWRECYDILVRVTNPLQKYANLGDDEIGQQEMTVRFVEEYLAIGDGDSAFWEKEYTHALGCYNLAFKLGHEDPSLYAKRSLCHLGNREPLRYLDDALSYMNAKDPYPVLPCSEEDAKQSVMAYFEEWKARYLADEDRSRGCCHPNTTSLKANDSEGSKNMTGVPSTETRKYFCKNCGKDFQYYQMLGSHRRKCKSMVLSGPEKFYCKYCGKDFRTLRSASSHMGRCRHKKAAHSSARHVLQKSTPPD